MGVSQSTGQVSDLVICPRGFTANKFAFSITVEAARAAAAAALSTAIPSILSGYTSQKTVAAGGASIRLQLLSDRLEACDHCVVSVRAEGRAAFLPGMAVLSGSSMEVIVLARPDDSCHHVTQLPECLLRKLFHEGSTVDVRLLRPLREETSEWLRETLVQLAMLTEAHFGRPVGGSTMYEFCEQDRASISGWLADAGLQLEESHEA